MMTNIDEYFADGSDFWFSHMQATVNGMKVRSHYDLEWYDPALYAALGKAYGGSHRLIADLFYRDPGEAIPRSRVAALAREANARNLQARPKTDNYYDCK